VQIIIISTEPGVKMPKHWGGWGPGV